MTMTIGEFVNFLDNHAVHYEVDHRVMVNIYVFEKRSFEKKEKHPRKNKDLYVPYLRVSHFDGPYWYVRDNGWCHWAKPEEVLTQILKMNK